MASPLHSIRFGGVSLSIWENKNGKYATKSCQIVKNYKDDKGSWKTTNSYNVSELVNVIQCCQQALDILYRRDASKKDDKSNDNSNCPF